jgi:glutathione synthase/RimK-type ligase-like ATP-grasp enzyme
MAPNGSKPYQAIWIESVGFRIPETLITTDPVAALNFWKRHERVIYKSVSADRSIVTHLTPEHLARFHNMASCPTQFQRYVSGVEYRVHVVGEDLFPCKIVSDEDDYRYASRPAVMEACELPAEVSQLCRTLARSMDLEVAGIDLRCTPENDWYCFEVNPSPAFAWFQDVTRQPIAQAIARLLAAAR